VRGRVARRSAVGDPNPLLRVKQKTLPRGAPHGHGFASAPRATRDAASTRDADARRDSRGAIRATRST
jgi:hypothetical protein